MDYQQMIPELKKKGASDLHLEPGLAPSARLQGSLIPLGDELVEGSRTLSLARSLLGKSEWDEFTKRQSFDLSCIIGGVRCRVSIMKTYRGVGLAIRLLSSFQPTLERLNLLPDLAKLVANHHGLIVVSGPTGSGKSSTLAALIHEINSKERLHIVTLESPIEYTILPRRSFVRQREVGRDTPSFDRALIDAMRQDPDVIMVGEMRERETIRLTLNAAETGQLVLSTLHSSNTADAMQRMVAAFPAEIQGGVCAQLADCLIAVVAQRLRFDESYGIRVPVCEILVATNAVRNLIRQGQFFKLASALETGHADGSWTFRRYNKWLEGRTDYFIPSGNESLDVVPKMPEGYEDAATRDATDFSGPEDDRKRKAPEKQPSPARPGETVPEDVIVIEEPDEKSLSDIIRKLEPGRE